METITIRTSERTTLGRCPQRWAFGYMDELAPLDVAQPLWFGTAVHESLAQWYQKGTKRGIHPAKFFADYIERENIRSVAVRTEYDEDLVKYEDAIELGIAMLENYVNHYGKDPNWDVIATEFTFHIYIKHPAGFRIRYVGTWDGVFIDKRTGEIWLMEHKTAASIDTSHLRLDNQAGSYWAVAEEVLRKKGILKDGMHIAGIMYNFLKKARRDDRPVNPDTGLTTNKPQKKHYAAALTRETGRESDPTSHKFWEKLTIAELESLAQEYEITVYGEPSAEQPAELLVREAVYRSQGERKKQIQRIRDEALYIRGMRNHDPAYPIIKSVEQFGPLACPRCPFFQVCQLNEAGDSMEDEMKLAMYKHWEPYSEHELEKKVA
jgi:hypothetical protein